MLLHFQFINLKYFLLNLSKMSISVNICDNPITVRRSKVDFSDFDCIKKSQREHLKRLRIEQVQHQSKDVSKQVLERARKAQEEGINNIEQSHNEDLQKYHDSKLSNAHQRYKGIESVGYSHKNASQYNKTDEIQEMQQKRNDLIAKERGNEANKKLLESTQQKLSAKTGKKNRIHNVRETENMRSSMVARLGKSSNIFKNKSANVGKNQANATKLKFHPVTKRRLKSINKNGNHLKPNLIKNGPVKRSAVQLNQDDQHPLEVDKLDSIESAAYSSENVETFKYNPSDYVQNMSSDTHSSTSSMSDDSSYFSDNSSNMTASNRLNRQVLLQDKKNAVIKSSRNAEVSNHDAPEERTCINLAKVPKENESRGENALLRERIRKDYHALLEKLNQLSREEKKLKSKQVSKEKNVELSLHRHQGEEKRQKRMNRDVQNVLTTASTEKNSNLDINAERIITLPPYSDSNLVKSSTFTEWTKPHSTVQHETSKNDPEYKYTENEMMEMLLKLKKMKKLLLKEHGSDLPTSIFKAGTNTLFEDTELNTNNFKQSSEVKVVDMLSDKDNKLRTANRSGVSCTPHTLKHKKSLPASLSYPLEPIVNVVTKDDGSSCSSEAFSDTLTIEFDSKKLSVRPNGAEVKLVNDDSSTSFKLSIQNKNGKYRLKNLILDPPNRSKVKDVKKHVLEEVSESHISSTPLKNCSQKKLNKSKCASKKKQFDLSSVHSSPGKLPWKPLQSKNFREKSSANKDVDDKTYKNESTQVFIESNLESENDLMLQSEKKKFSTKKLNDCCKTKQLLLGKVEKHNNKDTSDASTTYASPPLNAGTLIHSKNSSSSILEMLDSSANTTFMSKKNFMSPVSSPDTPSPRTIKLPSNKPNNRDACKTLLFSSGNYANVNEGFEQKHVKCHDKNKFCSLMHNSKDSKEKQCAKSTPELLKYYDNLQNVYMDRISSLDNLIQKVRREQTGLDFSISHLPEEMNKEVEEDSSSNNTMRALISNIENLRDKFKKTIVEAQKIIAGEGKKTPRQPIPFSGESPNLSDISKSASDKDIDLKLNSIPKTKPRIIKDECVNISLDKFLPLRKKINKSKPTKINEETVEKLKHEILEQSNHLNKPLLADVNDIDNNILISRKSSRTINKNNYTKVEECCEDAKTLDMCKEINGGDSVEGNFNSIEAGSSNSYKRNMGKTLFGTVYRSDDIGLPSCELSTIFEFDTPDSCNKIQNKIGSLDRNCKKNQKTSIPLLRSSERDNLSSNLHASESSVVFKKDDEKENKCTIAEKIHTDKSPVEHEIKEKDPESTEFLDFHTLPDEHVEELNVNNATFETSNQIKMETFKNEVIKNDIQLTITSSTSFSELSGISEATTAPSSDLNLYKGPSLLEEYDSNLKSLGLSWVIPTLKKTREASALSSSSNSDVTLKNFGKKVLLKKSEDVNLQKLEISDLSSISVKFINKSTDRSLLVKGRTSTPMRYSNSNSGMLSLSHLVNSTSGSDISFLCDDQGSRKSVTKNLLSS